MIVFKMIVVGPLYTVLILFLVKCQCFRIYLYLRLNDALYCSAGDHRGLRLARKTRTWFAFLFAAMNALYRDIFMSLFGLFPGFNESRD